MVDRNATVNLRGDVSNYIRSIAQARTATAAFVRSLDSSNDRMSMLVQTGLALGPALAPIGAAVVPALSGLTNQLALAGVGAGVAVLAFAGVGDALKDLNAYALEPTDSNFLKMQETMEALGPAGRDFVVYLQELRPELQRLQDVAQEGLFPGVMIGIDELMRLMPQVERIISEVSSTTGQLMAEAGDNLNDPRWREFFSFLEAEARPTLLDLGRTLGNFGEGFAQMWMAFDPISDRFSKSFLNLSRDFKEWASSLDQTEGFEDFVDYLARITPKVWDTLGSLAEALVAISVAAAPVGEAALPIIELMAETLTLISESPVGPVLIAAAAGISAVARAVALYNVAQGSQMASLLSGSVLGGAARAAKDLPKASAAFLDFGVALDGAGARAKGFRNTSERLGAALRGGGKLAAAAAGSALAMSDLGDSFALANTTSYALIGTLFGPWGAAIGGSIGLAKDFAASNDEVEQATARASAALADASLSFEQQQAAVVEANRAYREYKKDVEDVNLFDPAAFMSGLQDIFGQSGLEKATEQMRERNAALEEARIKTQEQKFEEAGLAGAMLGTSQSARDQTEALLDAAEAKNANRDAALEGRAAERDLEAALDAASEAATENGATFDITTEKGRANEAALDDIAGAWNNMTIQAQRVPGEYERVRADFVQTAIRMGRTRAEAEALANEILDIPTKVRTEATIVGTEYVLDQIERMNRAAANASRGIRYTAGYGGGQTMADGGLVRGPGGPRDDRVPAMLSSGEFVVNAAATSRNLGLLMQLNAKKYADGGLVSANTTPASSFQPALPWSSLQPIQPNQPIPAGPAVVTFEPGSVVTANPLEAAKEVGGEIAWRLRG